MISTQHTVRPFVGLEPLQATFDRMRLRVGNESIPADGHALVDSGVFASQSLRLEVASDDAALDGFVRELALAVDNLGLELADVELAVVVSSSYLKRVEVLVRLSGDELSDMPRLLGLEQAGRTHRFASPRGGARVDAVLCLARNVTQRALRPWRKGTWLAQIHFTVNSELTGHSFRMRPLHDVDRARLELPNGTMRHIEISGGSATDLFTDESSVIVWIDHQLLARLSANPSAAAAKAFQLQLFVDVVAAVVTSARAADGFSAATFEDLEDSLFGRVVNALAQGRLGQTPQQRRELRDRLIDAARTDAGKFVTIAEATVGTLSATMEALEQ